jgi:hypothetical protein
VDLSGKWFALRPLSAEQGRKDETITVVAIAETGTSPAVGNSISTNLDCRLVVGGKL